MWAFLHAGKQDKTKTKIKKIVGPSRATPETVSARAQVSGRGAGGKRERVGAQKPGFSPS